MTVFESYTFQYKDPIKWGLSQAQELANKICEEFEVPGPVVSCQFPGWGNCYIYTVDRADGDVPVINLVQNGLNIGTLAHELAHHIEVMKTGHDTHTDRHKNILRVIQDRLREILGG
jgi:hypothetical protein